MCVDRFLVCSFPTLAKSVDTLSFIGIDGDVFGEVKWKSYRRTARHVSRLNIFVWFETVFVAKWLRRWQIPSIADNSIEGNVFSHKCYNIVHSRTESRATGSTVYIRFDVETWIAQTLTHVFVSQRGRSNSTIFIGMQDAGKRLANARRKK